LFVVGENLLGLYQIGLKQGLRCMFHGDPCQPAHFTELVSQLRELLVVSGPHMPRIRGEQRKRCEATGGIAMNSWAAA